MLKMTGETLDAIKKKLDPPANALGCAVQKLKWPFQSGDIEKYMTTLERAKTWFIMVIMRDSTDTTAAIYAEVQRLASAVREEVVLRKTDLMLRETEEIIKWLSPVSSAEELARACQDRLPGTGRWIWDDQLTAWENGDPGSHPFFWITGKCQSAPPL